MANLGRSGHRSHARKRFCVAAPDHIEPIGVPQSTDRRGLPRRETMRIRTRKLIGAFALLALIALWALLAMSVAQFALASANGAIAAAYYVIAGVGWVLPAMPLVRWMSRPDEK